MQKWEYIYRISRLGWFEHINERASKMTIVLHERPDEIPIWRKCISQPFGQVLDTSLTWQRLGAETACETAPSPERHSGRRLMIARAARGCHRTAILPESGNRGLEISEYRLIIQGSRRVITRCLPTRVVSETERPVDQRKGPTIVVVAQTTEGLPGCVW